MPRSLLATLGCQDSASSSAESVALWASNAPADSSRSPSIASTMLGNAVPVRVSTSASSRFPLLSDCDLPRLSCSAARLAGRDLLTACCCSEGWLAYLASRSRSMSTSSTKCTNDCGTPGRISPKRASTLSTALSRWFCFLVVPFDGRQHVGEVQIFAHGFLSSSGGGRHVQDGSGSPLLSGALWKMTVTGAVLGSLAGAASGSSM